MVRVMSPKKLYIYKRDKLKILGTKNRNFTTHDVIIVEISWELLIACMNHLHENVSEVNTERKIFEQNQKKSSIFFSPQTHSTQRLPLW